jgi:hypothetical protein
VSHPDSLAGCPCSILPALMHASATLLVLHSSCLVSSHHFATRPSMTSNPEQACPQSPLSQNRHIHAPTLQLLGRNPLPISQRSASRPAQPNLCFPTHRRYFWGGTGDSDDDEESCFSDDDKENTRRPLSRGSRALGRRSSPEKGARRSRSPRRSARVGGSPGTSSRPRTGSPAALAALNHWQR